MCTHVPDETVQAQHSFELDEQQDHAFLVSWSVPGLAAAQVMRQIKVTSFRKSEMFVLLEVIIDFSVGVPVEQVARIPTLAWDAKQIFDRFKDAMVDPVAFFVGPIAFRIFNNSIVVHLQHFTLPFFDLWRFKRQV